jgi:hypothetical protein
MAAALPVEDDVASFIVQQARLVALERADDLTTSAAAMQSMSEKDAVKAGLCIPRLLLSDCRAGLYGRCLVTFVPERGDLLPATQIGVRDIVSIQPKAAANSGSQQWWSQYTRGGRLPRAPVACNVHEQRSHLPCCAVS